MQFKGVNNKGHQQCLQSEVSFKRMRNSAVFHLCGIGLALRGVYISQHGWVQLSSSSPSLFSFHCFSSATGACFSSLVSGGSWLCCSIVPAMGALFSLGAGYQKLLIKVKRGLLVHIPSLMNTILSRSPLNRGFLRWFHVLTFLCTSGSKCWSCKTRMHLTKFNLPIFNSSSPETEFSLMCIVTENTEWERLQHRKHT